MALEEEIIRIKKELTELNCQLVFGKTFEQLLKEIADEVYQKI